MLATAAHLKRICEAVPESNRLQALLESLARARGCQTADEVGAFLAPAPELVNPLSELQDLDKAVVRIQGAIARGENITIFGDYDCDGVTSTAQWVNLFRAASFKSFRVYIPDRFVEDYGLTPAAVEKCATEQNPSLIIAVDCGSTAIEALETLRARGVDVIVIDHHQVHGTGPHPSFAHLNPKGDVRFSSSRAIQDAALMSAAGLVFFVCDVVAKRAGIAWDRQANLLLAGLGTYVDVMPLVGTNRALVKHSLALANSPVLHRVPGIAALLEANAWGNRPVTDYTYGFVIGPCINATGRLAHAKTSLNLVCAQTREKAALRARELVDSNNERKRIQDGIVKEAMLQAEQLLEAAPDVKVLVLYGKDWHTGIVGIVAGKVKERFGRPCIVMARLENGYWKGSGRSIPSVDIGRFIAHAVKDHVLTSGGGHAMACGVKLTDEQVAGFVRWVREQSSLLDADLTPTHEILGDADWLTADQWTAFFDAAAPFGAGNPRPLLEVVSPKLQWGPEQAIRGDGTVWALKAQYSTPAHRALTATWTDIDQARLIFAPEQEVRLVSEFARTQAANGRTYDNWRVVHGELL